MPVPPAHEDELRERLRAAIVERTDDLEKEKIPSEVSATHLADLLALRMPLPHDVLRGLYSELDSETRARKALEEHARRPKFGQSAGE